MRATFSKFNLILLILSFSLAACNRPNGPVAAPPSTGTPPASPVPSASPTPSPVPARVLTVCLGQEPSSLFLYGDGSVAARAIRSAIYDGPIDVRQYAPEPVLLEKLPSLADGDARLEPVTVKSGQLVSNISGELVSLVEGVLYYPSGCTDYSCAQVYSGQGDATLDQMAVRFKLRPGITWSDGSPLTADDSLYSYEVAQALSPRARAGLLATTQAYTLVDENTVEWRGLPGYLDPSYQQNVFTPLPRHLWGSLPAAELLTAPLSSRQPLGWGPYQIDEWTAGDHVTLSKNPAYFRAGEGLPYFDRLVFRFVAPGSEALDALLAGECDYIDETAAVELPDARLQELQSAGKAQVFYAPGSAWEHLDFGLQPLDQRPLLFQAKETRQAFAMCLDRQKMAAEIFFGRSQVPGAYLPPDHPLANPELRSYAYDPAAANALLESVGWKDLDGNPATPRVSQGVAGAPDGTPLIAPLLTTDDPEKQRVASWIKESLAQCGVQVDISAQAWDNLFAPGPGGPLFGRNFALAQFGWAAATQPPCYLYLTAEIPAPYPQAAKGWGGANPGGYSNPEFDQLCAQALHTLPDNPVHADSHRRAQAIFAEDLPAIPLYQRLKLAVARPDLCAVTLDASADSALWNIEAFNYGEPCAP